jgi:manganese efflux pump family protein
MRQWLTVLGLTLPLCLDVFAVSIGVLGGMYLTLAQRIRITVLFLAFEIGMPLVGMAVGTPLTRFTGVTSNLRIDGAPANAYQIHAANLGHAADVVEYSFFGRYIDPIIVPLVVGAIGIWILDECLNDDDDDDDEAGKVRAMVTATGLSIIGLGMATSVDDLVIGFTLAFHNLPLHDIFTAIVIQAFLAITVGQFLGWKARTGSLRINVGRITAASKLAAGGLLVALAVVALLAPEIVTHVIPHFYHYRYIPPLGPSAVATPLPEGLDQGEAGHDDHHQGGQAGDPPHRKDLGQLLPSGEGYDRHRPQRQHAPDANRHRIVVPGGEVRDHDVRQVTEFSQEDHREGGRRHRPEPGGVGLPQGFVVVIIVCAQHQYGADQEHRSHRELNDPVREQAEEAAEGNRQHHVHRERRRRPGEHPARPVPGAEHKTRQPRVVRQFGYEHRPENDPDDEQARHVTTSPPGWLRRPGARCARQYG